MDIYNHLYRLSMADLKQIIASQYPHLSGSLYKCRKRDLVAEIASRRIFGQEGGELCTR